MSEVEVSPDANGERSGSDGAVVADADLLRWLRYAERQDRSDDDSLDRFIRQGQALCTESSADPDQDARLMEDWRSLAADGVRLIGPAFDPERNMKAWGTFQQSQRREIGRGLYEAETSAPPPARRASLVARVRARGRRQGQEAELPTWWTWKHAAAGWAREDGTQQPGKLRCFAQERSRLRLELLWANSHDAPARRRGDTD